jgi:hypothetical protein
VASRRNQCLEERLVAVGKAMVRAVRAEVMAVGWTVWRGRVRVAAVAVAGGTAASEAAAMELAVEADGARAMAVDG